MSDIVERLCETAGQLINGTMQDGDVPVAMLVEASDEIVRLRGALRPFAKLLEMIECTTSHEYFDTDDWDVPIGDLRRAAAAISSGNRKSE